MLRSITRLFCLTAIGSFATIIQAQSATANSALTVTVDGLRNRQGQICFSLFAQSQGFPNNAKRAIRTGCVKAASNPVTVTFRNLTAGTYAVSVIHDANNDGTINQGALGIPTEGFGFSRNPQVRTGPPRFGDAAIFIAGPNTTAQIRLQYLL